MSTRRIPGPGFAGDQGFADPHLARALAAHQADSGRRPDVLAAMHRSRVLAPVVAMAGETGTSAGGLAQEKSSDIAVPLLVGSDGRRGLPVFSSVDALSRWDATARPVPIMGGRAAEVALAESAAVLVVDVADPQQCVLEEPEVRALAGGRGTLPAYDDPVLARAVADLLATEGQVLEGRLVPWPGTDARLELVTPEHDPDLLADLSRRLADRLRALPEVAEASVRGLDLAVTATYLD